MEVHMHETMEEHFIIEKGAFEIMLNDKMMAIHVGTYIMINTDHTSLSCS